MLHKVARNSFETTNSLEEEVDCVRCSRHQSPKAIILTFPNDSVELVGRSESPDPPDKANDSAKLVDGQAPET